MLNYWISLFNHFMKTIILHVAGFNIKIIFKDSEVDFYRLKWISDIENHYSDFISNKNIKKANYTIEFREKRMFTILKKKNGKENFMVFSIDADKNLIITFYSIGLNQFESIMMKIISKLLQKSNGFFFHTSASFKKNKAFLFIGKSGAGKSTVINLLKNSYRPLADDIAIIRKFGHKYYIFQTIGYEKTRIIKREAKGYLIDKLFFLEKSDNFRVQKINDKSHVTEKIMSQLVTYEKNKGIFLKYLIEFVAINNRFYKLFFARDAIGLKKVVNQKS